MVARAPVGDPQQAARNKLEQCRSPAFGGYKQSGFGRELSIDTLDLYLETQAVVQSTGSRPSNPFGL